MLQAPEQGGTRGVSRPPSGTRGRTRRRARQRRQGAAGRPHGGRGRRRADARCRTVARAAAVGGRRHLAGPCRRRVRERRLPVPRSARHRRRRHGHGHRSRGRPVVAGAFRLAAARRGRGITRRALAGEARRPPRQSGRRRGRAAAHPPTERGAPHRRPVRQLRRTSPGDAPRMGGRTRRRMAIGVVEAAARANRPTEPG